MIRCLWLSRHAPLEKQVNELKRLFGDDVMLIIDPQPFSSADDIEYRMREHDCSEIVVVAPLSVIHHLTQRGIKPLWAEMELVERREFADTEVSGRYFRFVRFRRIVSITIEYEDFD